MDTIQNPIVIFEPFTGGHRGIFVQHLYQELLKRGDTPKTFIFYVNPLIAPQLVPVSSSIKVIEAASPGNVSPLTQLKELCKEFNPQEIMLMALGDLEWALCYWRCPVPISSILFVQYPEMKKGLKRWFKEKKTAYILKRTDVRHLFLLNGANSVAYLSQRFPGKTKFIAIPDPVNPWSTDLEIKPSRKGAKTVFLYFGAISRRKGFGLLVDAMLKLSAEEHGRMKFLFCGRPEDPGYFDNELMRLKNRELPVNLEIVQRFLTEEEMAGQFLGADVILMPYLRPEYSSGVLGIAAQAQRPVIGPDKGLLGRLIREHGLGKACRMNSGFLKDALLEAAISGVELNLQAAAAFVEKSSPEQFATCILHELELE